MFGNLTVNELDAYISLCERNMEFLATKRRLNPSNKVIGNDYSYMLTLRNKLYEEINTRLKNIHTENEPVKEDIQQD